MSLSDDEIVSSQVSTFESRLPPESQDEVDFSDVEDPVEGDTFSQLSDRESIQEFSQHTLQTCSETIEYITLTQSQDIDLAREGTPLALKFDIPETRPGSPTGPENFVFSAPSTQPTDALSSFEVIIQREKESFRKWQEQVDLKIFQHGSIINAFQQDTDVFILQINDAWTEYGLLFAKCSLMNKDELDTEIHYIPDSETSGDSPPRVDPSIPLDTLFIFSFAMQPMVTIEEMKTCKIVAVWDPTFDLKDMDYDDEVINTCTMTRFKIIV